MTVLPLMARVTRHLGLGNTISTTFNQPYQIARSLGSLDLLSRGRAAWNVVTSATDYEARNCGMDGVPPKDDRYDRADDVLEACCALWDCWEPTRWCWIARAACSPTRARSATPTMSAPMSARAGRCRSRAARKVAR